VADRLSPDAATGSRPRLLDLFCGAGGCAVGYERSGFEVVYGVDLHPQPRYPFEFRQDDALHWLECVGMPRLSLEFDAIHASPPCQGYSVQGGDEHPLLIEPVREALLRIGLPYVIENIPDAAWAMRNPTVLCGSSFGLRVRRHRLFETNWPLMGVACAHGLQSSNPHRIRAPYTPPEDAIVPVYGGGQVGFPVERCRAAMGIDWMTLEELKEAIPPAYTEFIGHQLLAHIRQAVAA
jgi:DNA (cytosine-5)-methyltransferase 1